MTSSEKGLAVALGQTFRTERERQGTRQLDAARALCIVQSQLSKLERGASPWSVVQLFRYSKHLDKDALTMLADAIAVRRKLK